ncbi:MAG: tRNA dihydrouridine synthase DusB [Elusimicrobiota bacterium]|jgi:tRNA-dihydrouridine synthase B|nr:tRNA dihydrouridine synthase DusB [Elusimicrobiota bacterium]
MGLKIGGIELKNNIFLAPMAGISDFPLRSLAKENGAGLVYTEMVSAKALLYGDKKTRKLFYCEDAERPIAFQIFGSAVNEMGEAAKIAADLGADIIDINLGCPVRKIAKAGAGAKLLENEKMIADILENTVKKASVPVTIKTRLGLKKGEETASRVLEICCQSGVRAMALHARYASQGHSGEIDFETFAKVCANAKIPIIANGSIIDENSAQKFSAVKNCSAQMIGRGAIGNYSIFKRLDSFLNRRICLPPPSLKERTEYLKKHFEKAFAFYGEQRAVILMRKTIPYYLKDFPEASKFRALFNQAQNRMEFEKLITEIENKIEA